MVDNDLSSERSPAEAHPAAARGARPWRSLWRHLWLDEHDVRRTLPPSMLEQLTHAVRASEARHLGEIRLCIEAALPLSRLLVGCSPRQRAQALYERFGIGRTRGRTGVLVYLLWADRSIELVVDPALQDRIPADEWQAVIAPMPALLRDDNTGQALREAIARLDALLRAHVPAGGAAPRNGGPDAGGARPNELPDEPLLM